jgi:hypothetical protein
MTRGLAAVLLILTVTATSARASTLEPEQVSLLRYYDGTKFLFCFQAPMSRVKRLPTWNGDASTLPLSRERAQAVALEAVKASYPSVSRLQPSSTEFNRVAVRFTDTSVDVWYYIVEFASVEGANRRHSSREYVSVVLLDGKSVPKQTDRCLLPLREHK